MDFWKDKLFNSKDTCGFLRSQHFQIFLGMKMNYAKAIQTQMKSLLKCC